MDFPPELTDDPYYHLAQTGPYAPVIGAALITMVEPHVGHERAYNRWYEDDHYNAGAMAFTCTLRAAHSLASALTRLLRAPLLAAYPGTLMPPWKLRSEQVKMTLPLRRESISFPNSRARIKAASRLMDNTLSQYSSECWAAG